MKKKTIIQMVVGILFLLTLIISSTYAYFNIVNTSSNNTTSNYNAKLEDIEKYGTSLLTGGEGELHLRVKASDMTPSKIGNKYYATTSEDDYQLRRGNHIVSKATIQKGLSNYEYNCTSKLTITLSGTMVSEDGLQEGDAKLYLKGANNNIKNEEYDLKTLIDELDTNSDGKKEYTREIEYLLTSDNEGKVMIDVEFANNSNNQTTSSGKNLNIEITNSELVCGLGNDKVYVQMDTWTYGDSGRTYRTTEWKKKIITASFVDYKPSEEELLTKPIYWDLTNTNKSEVGSVIGWLEEREEDDTYDLYIGSDKEIYATTLDAAFYQMTNLQKIKFDNLNTSETTDMSQMFRNCSNLNILDLSHFDTSKVTRMNYMFESNNLIDLDVSHFDTSNVNTMNFMFAYSKVVNLDLSTFDTSKVTNMYGMFNGCSNLTELDISNFDTSKVRNMESMFKSCNKITNLDLRSFDTSNVTTMYEMFYDCFNLVDLNLISFDTSQVINMSSMFYRCRSFTTLDLSHFNTSNLTNVSNMFRECSNLINLNLANFKTTNVDKMSMMFFGCSSLTNLDLSSFDTSKITDMSYMFSGCTNLSDLNLSSFNTTNVTNMYNMFNNCTSLKELKLNKAIFDNVTSYIDMFGYKLGNSNYRVPIDIHLTIKKGQETFINDRLNDIFPEGHNATIDLVD